MATIGLSTHVRQIQRSKFWFCYGGMYLALNDGPGICPDQGVRHSHHYQGPNGIDLNLCGACNCWVFHCESFLAIRNVPRLAHEKRTQLIADFETAGRYQTGYAKP